MKETSPYPSSGPREPPLLAGNNDAIIDGQMAKIRKAIEEELGANAPIADLKPGQVYGRLCKRMKAWGLEPGEIPSRSTFNRFRRRYGMLPPWREA
jgi:hypothetical protein